MFSNATIKQKMTGIFALIVLLFVGFAGFSANSARSINTQSTELADIWLAGTEVLGRLKAELSEIRIKQGRHILELDMASMKATEKELRAAIEDLKKIDAEYEPTIILPEDRRLFDKYLKSKQPYP